MTLTRTHLIELFFFGLVGVGASVIHFVAAILFIEAGGLSPGWANIGAFLCAFPASYIGHAYLTFRAEHYGREKSVTKDSFWRFAGLALTGFALNQTSVVIFAEILGFPHRPVLLLTILGVACIMFLGGKLWAFNAKGEAL